MNSDVPSSWALVKIPALITLLVTGLRLTGEILEWSAPLFRNIAPYETDAAGTPIPPGVIGITWLLMLFGFWFGLRLRRTGGGPDKLGKTFGLFLLSIIVVVGGAAACIQTGLISMPHDAANPSEPTGAVYAVGLLFVGVIIAFVAWGRVALALLLYGVLARVPVIIVTWFAVQNEWGTHYEKLPVGHVAQVGNDLFFSLALSQAFFWIPFTVIVGGLFACIGAVMGGRGPTRPYG